MLSIPEDAGGGDSFLVPAFQAYECSLRRSREPRSLATLMGNMIAELAPTKRDFDGSSTPSSAFLDGSSVAVWSSRSSGGFSFALLLLDLLGEQN